MVNHICCFLFFGDKLLFFVASPVVSLTCTFLSLIVIASHDALLCVQAWQSHQSDSHVAPTHIIHASLLAMTILIRAVQECDARDDDSSNAAGLIKFFSSLLLTTHYSLFTSSQPAAPHSSPYPLQAVGITPTTQC